MRLDKKKMDIAMANAGMNGVQTAQKAGISPVMLSVLRRGKRSALAPTVGKIAKALGVPAEEIIKPAPEQEAPSAQ